jgi:hypothetical protein
MTLDLTEEETDALAKLLRRTIDDDRYPPFTSDTDFEGHFNEAPPRARPRALAAAEGVRAAAGNGSQQAPRSVNGYQAVG